MEWSERLLGAHLLDCNTGQPTPTQDIFRNVQFTGLYFTFANVKVDEIIRRLKALHEKLRPEKRFEVVQIVLWAHNDVYGGDFQKSHDECVEGMPWYAVPYSQIELKTRLARKYRVKSGVPALVLLDRDGTTVSVSAQDRLLEDPAGSAFPWRPRPVDQVLKDVVLQRGGRYQQEHKARTTSTSHYPDEVCYAHLPDAIRGFYFCANWCPPCRAFTPLLAEAYRSIRKQRDADFEIVFVSSDRSAESYNASVDSMPWLAVPWQQSGVRAELAQLYGIRGIPTLLLLDRNGHVITTDARTELAEDPQAQNFPWKPRPVNILTERHANKLHDCPAIILFVEGDDTELQFAESVLKPAAETYTKTNNESASSSSTLPYCGDEQYGMQFLVGLDSETSDILRDLIGLDDVVPLLVGVDLPRRRCAVMEYGVEITVSSVDDFVKRFHKGQVTFRDVIDDKTLVQ